VDYSLTDRGREIAVLLIPLMQWIVQHAEEIVVADD
jgi:DNA-binding HxlR family transcriptional regulator